jgi:transcriptional regulator with XRE-family HTH domain
MNNIAKYRKEAGLTQVSAGERAGWGQSRWSGYETGDRTPNADDITEILRVLRSCGVTVCFDDLFSDSESRSNLVA